MSLNYSENDELRSRLAKAIAEIDSLRGRERELMDEISDGQAKQQELHLIAGGICEQRDAAVAECDSLRAQLGEAQAKNEEIAQELVSAACELADYMGEDPEGALASLRADLSGYSKLMWAIARLLNSGSAKPEDVEAAVKERVTERDTLRSENERLRSAVAWAYQMVGARWPNEQALDNLSDVLAGKTPRQEWPCVPPQSDDVERLRSALRLIQWGRFGHPMRQTPFCPRCLFDEPHGHAPDCEVGAALAGETAPDPEPRWFPVHPCDRNRIHHVPWSLLDAHEDQALLNHDQSLDRLASRGGLSLCEMRAVISDKYYFELTPMECESAEAFIHTVIAEAQSETGGAA